MADRCLPNCNLRHRLAEADRRVENLERVSEWLDDIHYNLPLLEPRRPWSKKARFVEKQIRITNRRIRRILNVLRLGCNQCHDGGIVFV